MRPNALVDTGAILAILRPHDRWHRPCVEALGLVRLPLLTSEAVLTELFHLIGNQAHDVEAAWSFVCSGALTLGSITDAELSGLAVLMRRYHDRPMDFADATMVQLAERESLTTILTVDFSDFQTYRIGGRRHFRILPKQYRLS